MELVIYKRLIQLMIIPMFILLYKACKDILADISNMSKDGLSLKKQIIFIFAHDCSYKELRDSCYE